jgi:hypothetical protein
MNSDCPQIILVSQLIDNELSDEERSRLIDHIAQCEVCAGEIENIKKVRSSLELLEADPSTKRRIRRAVLSQPPPKAFACRRLSVPLPIAAAIALLLGASVIGNAYFGFFRTVGEQAIHKNVVSPDVVSDSAKQMISVKKDGSPEIKHQAMTDAKIFETSSSHKKHKKMGVTPSTSGVEPFVTTLQTDRYIAEFATTTEYRFYPLPKIYSGGFNPSE